MKARITALLLCLLLITCALPASAFKAHGAGEPDGSLAAGEALFQSDPGETVPADGTATFSEGGKLGYGIDYVNATFREETHNVLNEVMEIDGGMAAPIDFKWDYTRYVDLSFGLTQRNGEQVKELVKTREDNFRINADTLEIGWPIYFDVYSGDDGKLLSTTPLGIRINKGLIASRTPDNLQAEFSAGIKVDMSEFLPGMELNVLPFLIPVTVKTYTDGAIRVGIGVNASDVDFWMKAGNGEMPEQDLGNQLKELFYGDPHKLDDVKSKGMGVLFIFSGWAEGNMNDTSPILGHMELFVGTGFDVQGQYGIFTWEVTLTGGAQGIFDFSFNFNEEDSKYHFSADEFRLGVKGGLELYGGVGCMLASVGVYGAGSIAYQERIYPDAEAEHLVLAGEVGLKAKLFGKVIACFKIVSGSHDFVFDKKKKNLSLSLEEEKIRQFLLDNDYAHAPVVHLSTEGTMTWHGEFVEQPVQTNGWEDDPDFAHLLAENISPDSSVHIVSSGSHAFPEMTLVFMGNNAERTEGNRSMLMSSYYDIGQEFVSTPKAVHDDGTADYNPYVYADPESWAYMVWENANAPVPENATLAEISNMTDLWFGSCITSANWTVKKVTDYAGTGIYATGARVVAYGDNQPAIVYYTNTVDDPAGLAGKHEVYLATKSDSLTWVSEKICEVNGAMGGVDVAPFDTMLTVSVSWEENGVRKTALYRGGKQVWSKDNASAGKFIGAGYKGMYFTWYENGQIRKLSVNFEESDFTPKEFTITDDSYEIFGRMGSSTVMVAGTSVKDAEGGAFAYVSRDGGLNWARADLSKMNEFAYVSSLSVAYTEENDPVVVYSLQNYQVNVDLEGTLKALDGDLGTLKTSKEEGPLGADGEEALGVEGSRFLLGQDDDRFTDTRTDLYISARRANKHVTFEDAWAVDYEKNKPGQPAKVCLRIRNTGLYDVEKASIVCNDVVIGFLDHTLKPWETADIEVEVKLPLNIGTQIQEFTFDVSTKDDLTPDSRIKVEIPEGYLTAKIWHSFEHGEEGISYRIDNCGYTDKTAHIVVRDEARDVTLQDFSYKVDGGWHSENTFKAGDSVFVKDGIQNVTLYVLIGDETYESSEISSNRVKSITPLPEIYGQSVHIEVETAPSSETGAPDNKTDAPSGTSDSTAESGTDTPGSQSASFRDWIPLLVITAVVSVAIVAGIAIGVKIAKKKREEKEAEAGAAEEAEGAEAGTGEEAEETDSSGTEEAAEEKKEE